MSQTSLQVSMLMIREKPMYLTYLNTGMLVLPSSWLLHYHKNKVDQSIGIEIIDLYFKNNVHFRIICNVTHYSLSFQLMTKFDLNRNK